jgi:hypothetical protein
MARPRNTNSKSYKGWSPERIEAHRLKCEAYRRSKGKQPRVEAGNDAWRALSDKPRDDNRVKVRITLQPLDVLSQRGESGGITAVARRQRLGGARR